MSSIVLTTRSGNAMALQLLYRNTTSTPCTVRGYPTVTAIAVAAKTQLAVPQTTRSSLGPIIPVQTVELTPETNASALVEWNRASHTNSNSCVWVGHLAVTPPESTTSSLVARDGLGQACDMHVLPLVVGTAHDGYVLAPPARTTLGLVISHRRLGEEWRVLLAPAIRHVDGQIRAIPGRPTLTYNVPDSLVPDNGITLVGPVEVAARGTQVTALTIVGG